MLVKTLLHTHLYDEVPLITEYLNPQFKKKNWTVKHYYNDYVDNISLNNMANKLLKLKIGKFTYLLRI